MNIPGIPDLKTPLLWLLGLGLAAALVGLGFQQIELANVREKLATEVASRATENAQRATLAAGDEKQTAGAQTQHATDQQRIVHELTTAKQDLALARAGRADADVRVRDTAAKLAAARAQLEARGDTIAAGSCEDQHRTAFRLLEEGFRLANEAGGLAIEGRDLLAGRDAEVKALVELVHADRALMQRAAAPPVQP